MHRLHRQHTTYVALLLAAVAWQACKSGGSIGSDELAGTDDWVDTSRLLEIERRVLPECLIAGRHKQKDLPAYYREANRQLSEHLDHARQVFETASIRPYRSMTLVSGTAGIGKTFIKSRVFRKSYAAGDVFKFDIKDLYEHWQQRGLVEEKPDLYCGNTVLSHLLGLKHEQKDTRCLIEYLKAKSAAFYVIDSLDEVHPDDYLWILHQIEQFVLETEQPFIQVVLFGRGLAFHEYLQTKTADELPGYARLFVLNPPKFTTTGDLLVSNWNYDNWRYQLRWSPDVDEPVEMPLAEYQQWVAEGYPVTGKFHTVIFEANDSMNPEARSLLQDWSQKYRITIPMLQNLAGNGILRSIVEDFATNNRPFDERQVLEAYLAAWLKRDGKSSNRPSASSSQHLDLYMRLFEEIAAKYLVEKKLDEDGYFAVEASDAIEIQWQGETLTFPVTRILNRSGMKLFEAGKAGAVRYRFEPFWMHRLLIEMRNDRLRRGVTK